MNARRWLLYTCNGEGLGHLTRMLALARQLRRRSPESEILFVTSCEAASLLWQEGFAGVKVPSAASVTKAGLQLSTFARLIRSVVPDVVTSFAPDAIVVDTFPAGIAQDLLPVLATPVPRALIYREMKKGEAANPAFQSLLGQYHRLLVPHPEGEAEVPAPANVPREFVGHMLLRSRDEALPREEARRRLGLPADGLALYVGFGGAGNTRLARWVFKQAGSFPAWRFACAIPPMERDDSVASALPNVSFFRYWPLAECWRAFDGAISSAGYNSAAELMHHGVPTIWTPVEAMVDDQNERARQAVRRGAGWLVEGINTPALLAALRELGEPDRRKAVSESARDQVPVNGAQRAAESLLRWTSQQDTLDERSN